MIFMETKKTPLGKVALYYAFLGGATLIFTACVLLSAHGIALLLGTTL
jgi:hypothetical protein